MERTELLAKKECIRGTFGQASRWPKCAFSRLHLVQTLCTSSTNILPPQSNHADFITTLYFGEWAFFQWMLLCSMLPNLWIDSAALFLKIYELGMGEPFTDSKNLNQVTALVRYQELAWFPSLDFIYLSSPMPHFLVLIRDGRTKAEQCLEIFIFCKIRNTKHQTTSERAGSPETAIPQLSLIKQFWANIWNSWVLHPI